MRYTMNINAHEARLSRIDLPAGGVSGAATLASGGFLVLVGAFWARRLSSVVPRPRTVAAEVWRQILAFHAAAWATLFLSSAALHGLRVLLAPL